MITIDGITTLNSEAVKIKTFYFDSIRVDKPEAKAKAFCRHYKMKFLGLKIVKPYTLHEWQHYDAITFQAECTSQTPLLMYEYGK